MVAVVREYEGKFLVGLWKRFDGLQPPEVVEIMEATKSVGLCVRRLKQMHF